MRAFVLALAIAFAVYATPAHADPVQIAFDLHIETIGGPHPELALGVFGEMPQVGSTMRAVDRLNPQDLLPEEPNRGWYSNDYWLHPGNATLTLTVGSSTTPVQGSALMDVEDNISFATPGDTDRIQYLINDPDGGQMNISDRIRFWLGGVYPPSTFTSDALPPPTALQSGLRFDLAVRAFGYDGHCDEEDFCEAFTLSGTARAVESPAPVPEPSTWLLVASGLAMLVKDARRKPTAPTSPMC